LDIFIGIIFTSAIFYYIYNKTIKPNTTNSNSSSIPNISKPKQLAYFKQYYPQVDMLDKDQLNSYLYIKSKILKGEFVEVEDSISYIYLIVIEIFQVLADQQINLNQAIKEIETIIKLYKSYDDLVYTLSCWLSSLYQLTGSIEKAHFYEKNPYYLLAIKLLYSFEIKGENYFDFGKSHLTKSVKEYEDKLKLLINDVYPESGDGYLQELAMKYMEQAKDQNFYYNEAQYTLFQGLIYGHILYDLYSKKNKKIIDEISFVAQSLQSANKEIQNYSKSLCRDAENQLRSEMGLPAVGEGWISETKLYKQIKKHFPQYEVIQHYTADWLGRQHLDVFIKELNVGIEYHGKQHFEPVNFFGGEKAFIATKKRDSNKKRKCTVANVKLIIIQEGYDFVELVSGIMSNKSKEI